jgi:hypothetical protein
MVETQLTQYPLVIQSPAHRRDRRWIIMAAAVWTIVVVACCVHALVKPRGNSLYPLYSEAARHWLAGKDMYGELAPGFDRYRYSPLAAVLVAPFSVLPDGLGAALWRLLNAAVYLAGFAWFVRAVLPATLSGRQRAILFLLIVPLSAGSLYNGQANVLVIGLLLAAVAAAKSDRWNLAAVCVAAACHLKVYPIAVGLLLAALYPRRFAARLALAVAAGAALPFAFQHLDYVVGQYANWWDLFQVYDRAPMALKFAYRDLRLLCRVWLTPLDARTYLLIQLGVAAGMAAVCVAGRRRGWPRERLLVLLLGLSCSWMTVLGPATESCTYILLAPTLAWALVDAWAARRSLVARWLPTVSFAAFLVCQVAVWFPDGASLQTLGGQPLAGLLLLLGLL